MAGIWGLYNSQIGHPISNQMYGFENRFHLLTMFQKRNPRVKMKGDMFISKAQQIKTYHIFCF
jgi:hypothetical protein